MKFAKNMQKTILHPPLSCSIQKTARKEQLILVKRGEFGARGKIAILLTLPKYKKASEECRAVLGLN